ADPDSERVGDGEAFGIQRLDQAPDRVGGVGVLEPGLATLHPRQIAERDREVVLWVEVAERDGDHVVARHEAVAEQGAAGGEPGLARVRRQRGDVHFGTYVADT